MPTVSQLWRIALIVGVLAAIFYSGNAGLVVMLWFLAGIFALLVSFYAQKNQKHNQYRQNGWRRRLLRDTVLIVLGGPMSLDYAKALVYATGSGWGIALWPR